MPLDVRAKMITYLQEAHAMEQSVARMLERMIATTDDPGTKALLEEHHLETERHEQLVMKRLEALGETPSPSKELPAMVAATVKGFTDLLRGDKPARDGRDGYVTEHLEIATYQLLEELAERAGDRETANVARRIRSDEEEMAAKLAASWGKFVDIVLADERDLERAT